MNKTYDELKLKYKGDFKIIEDFINSKDFEQVEDFISTPYILTINYLQQRIDKAIEYLESYNTDFKNSKFGEAPISLRELGDLLDILRGKDNE